MAERLLIIGASARAAADSAQRAGFEPWAIDRFGDRDLTTRFPARQARRYPRDLERTARELPPMPWLYTGALENHPLLVERIAAQRPLYGNRAAVLRNVRDPWQVARTLRAAGFEVPELCDHIQTPGAQRYLAKRLRSAGGGHITLATSTTRLAAGNYYQQYIEGVPCSAVYVAAQGAAVLLGATRQLIGCPWAGTSGFRFVGSIGPLRWPAAVTQQAAEIGNCLAQHFHLTGLFGIDYIWGDESLWTIEVNPRYTASVEILERASGYRAIEHHVQACRDQVLPELARRAAPACFCGKAILYCRDDMVVPADLEDRCRLAGIGEDQVADIPWKTTQLAAGQPLLTIFADAPVVDNVLPQLETLASELGERMKSKG